MAVVSIQFGCIFVALDTFEQSRCHSPYDSTKTRLLLPDPPLEAGLIATLTGNVVFFQHTHQLPEVGI